MSDWQRPKASGGESVARAIMALQTIPINRHGSAGRFPRLERDENVAEPQQGAYQTQILDTFRSSRGAEIGEEESIRKRVLTQKTHVYRCLQREGSYSDQGIFILFGRM